MPGRRLQDIYLNFFTASANHEPVTSCEVQYRRLLQLPAGNHLRQIAPDVEFVDICRPSRKMLLYCHPCETATDTIPRGQLNRCLYGCPPSSTFHKSDPDFPPLAMTTLPSSDIAAASARAPSRRSDVRVAPEARSINQPHITAKPGKRHSSRNTCVCNTSPSCASSSPRPVRLSHIPPCPAGKELAVHKANIPEQLSNDVILRMIRCCPPRLAVHHLPELHARGARHPTAFGTDKRQPSSGTYWRAASLEIALLHPLWQAKRPFPQATRCRRATNTCRSCSPWSWAAPGRRRCVTESCRAPDAPGNNTSFRRAAAACRSCPPWSWAAPGQRRCGAESCRAPDAPGNNALWRQGLRCFPGAER